MRPRAETAVRASQCHDGMLVGCARVRRNTECAQTQATHRQNQKYPIYPESQFYYVRGPPRPGATHRLVATALHGQARSLAGTGSGERRSRRGRGEALARARTLRTLPPAAPAPDTHARRMAQGTPPPVRRWPRAAGARSGCSGALCTQPAACNPIASCWGGSGPAAAWEASPCLWCTCAARGRRSRGQRGEHQWQAQCHPPSHRHRARRQALSRA